MDALGASEARKRLLAALALLPRATNPERPILLAVSGGPDSLALLLLAAENAAALREAGFVLLAATVDHALRPESAGEAAMVGRLCDGLHVPHRTLVWTGNKPASDLAAAAREARYLLLTDHAERTSAAAILTAHHEDDQIETHQLALARRAGDRGLAGMRPVRTLSPRVFLLRPFLGVAGDALKAVAAERGIRPVDDPANRDPRFARARLRAASSSRAPAERRRILARISAHAAARDDENAALAEWIANNRQAGRLVVDERGVVRLDADALHTAAPRTVAIFLDRALRAAGGAAYPPPHAGVEGLGARMRGAGFRGATLGGAAVTRANGSFAIFREYGRSGLPPAALSAAEAPVFDRRFRVAPSFSGAGSLVAYGWEGKGGAIDRTLPVLLSEAGELVAAHPALTVRRLPRAVSLGLEGLVGFRLFADLP